MSSTHKFSTDVLIIGGGHAALFAAIKAKKSGADVIVVDKSYAGKSGQSPYTDSLCIFDPKLGHKMDKWLEGMAIVGEYVNNPAWSQVVFDGSLEVFEQVTAMGLKCHEYMDEVFRLGGEDGGLETVFHPKNFVPEQARKEALKLGVKIIDRVMISELIKEDGKIIGAVGFCAEEAEMYVFDAKATIMCAGAVGFKPNGWPIHNLTGDADAMAYRVGNEILGKEFIDTHAGPATTPAFIPFAKMMKKDAPPMFPGHPEAPPRVSFNAEGDAPKFNRAGLWLSNEFEMHAGRGPVSGTSPMGKATFTGGASLGMACHKTEGIVAADDLSCATQIDGLYAAGDALGNMASGANYTVMGFAATHAMVSGNISGENAAKYAAASSATQISDGRIATAKAAIYAPLERKGGFAPRWVNQVLKNTLMPYFILYIKHEERLKGALAYIEFMQSHMVPMLKAHDAHELRLAHETKNMLLNAEMKLRSSMARKESRGSHYRDDYPQRNDDFLAWVKLKDDAGEMNVRVDPIPQELLPHELLAKPYEERYPLRLPKEIDGVE